MTFEEQVRERAYHIWLAGGMVEGQAHEHWTMAESAAKAAEPVVIITKPSKAKAKPAAKAKPVAKAAKPVAKKATTVVAVAAH